MRLQIEKMVYGGAGVAHPTQSDSPGEAVLVPFTLPGEVVEIRVAESKGGTAEASLLKVLTPSESRVQPGCTHFGECGGCQYQHASYSAQIAIKTAILRETLEHAGLSALPAIQAHTGESWTYRNRSRLRVELHNGELRVGYNRRGSNEFLPIRECPISASLIWRASETLLRVAAENTPAGRWAQSAAEVEFFVTGDEKKLQMTVFVKKDRAGFAVFCERMKELLPELTGAGTALLPAGGPQRQTQKARQLSSWGAAGLSYRVADEDYWVSRGGFFQVNRFLLDELVELVAVVTNGRRGLVAWDLYAGAGLFSRVLARSFERVVAVEAVGDDLIRTFKGTGRYAVKATTAEFLRGAVLQRERPELIVVDPPRAGIGDEVCALLARVSAPEIIYVSCDPVTLARDLKTLAAGGYRLTDLHMVDLFPQTFHLETVAVLRK
jgi:23S rRNA (uracil1939-C5)-methyltransferase